MAEISGAIFDCDGTLIDSMGMWYSVLRRLTESHGLVASSELRERLEPMTIPDSCAVLHEDFGLGESAEALVEELHTMVAHAYTHSIGEIPGARAFVHSLVAAHIPLVVASSTTSSLVREALRVQGIDSCFEDVLCTAEVRCGRDKDFPDVYLAALERLGTPGSQTWVFEDAPFGVRTARRAGFHVVGIHNDHDGRDEALVRAWSDVYSENYTSVSLEAICAFDDEARAPMPEG